MCTSAYSFGDKSRDVAAARFSCGLEQDRVQAILSYHRKIIHGLLPPWARECQTLIDKKLPRSYSSFSSRSPGNLLGSPKVRVGISPAAWVVKLVENCWCLLESE
uniref:SFRICE_031330 n=1 Tax=Spodoptera frugiperda TaxID=7108 RepID=A0A2H1V164_SPOFR